MRKISRTNLLITVFLPVLLSIFSFTSAQNMQQAREDIDFLTSKKCWGRGYTKNGMNKARNYLTARLKKEGLEPLNGTHFFQPLTSSINTFPNKMNVKLNGKTLTPGVDYIIGEESCSIRGNFLLQKKDSVTWIAKSKEGRSVLLVRLEKKLTWSVSVKQEPYTVLHLLKDSLKSEPSQIELEVDANFQENFSMDNICAFVRGKTFPDSFIVFTAHYDHLGGMGKSTYFPGANDNASGVSMLLQLAEHYQKNPPPFSVAFVFFCGEEAGLLGSRHYTLFPVFPLQKIKFLINLDLLGTGEDGITVVNATVFPSQFDVLKKLNQQQSLLTQIKPRGKAANSDHYWFSEMGVPCFFIYTLGGIKAYHDVFDRPSTLPLTKFRQVFSLLIEFQKDI